MTLRGIVKRFGELTVLNGVNLEVKEGEFVTLLGPSGCGKTTTLRLIAGFIKPDAGEILFNDKVVNDVPVWKRNIGIVFQDYALWPHMTVFDNIAYGLKVRKVGKREIRRRVKEVLELLNIKGLEDRKPSQLSGGQQQRVALARALVVEPDVLLLDEPLSNLDAKIRVNVRGEIKKLQRKLKITTIWVTHDQEEALSISDRVAIIHDGKIEQVGTPLEVYESPRTPFVADFIGQANLIEGEVAEIKEGCVEVNTKAGAFTVSNAPLADLKAGGKVFIVFRPEDVVVLEPEGPTPGKGNVISGEVRYVYFMGNIVRGEVSVEGEVGVKIEIYNPKKYRGLKEGKKVGLYVPPESIAVIPAD